MSDQSDAQRHKVEDSRYEDLLRILAKDEEMAAVIIERVIARIPDYAHVPATSLVKSVERNRALAINTLRTGVIPRPDDIWEAALATRERLDQGVQIEDIMVGFREVLKEIQGRVIEATQKAGIPSEMALQASTLLWDLGDTFTARISHVYRELQIDRQVTRYRAREEWVRRLLSGGLSDDEVRRGNEAIGITGSLKALVTAPLQANMLTTLPDTLVLSDGRAVGFLPATDHLEQPMNYAEGPKVKSEQLHESLALAMQIQKAAELVGLTGRNDLSTISWRLAVPHSAKLNDGLRMKFIDPLLEHGGFGEAILEALHAFLKFDLKTIPAAESIPIHPNTLRYRLHKFEDITKVSLSHFNTLIEVSWAMASIGRTVRYRSLDVRAGSQGKYRPSPDRKSN